MTEIPISDADGYAGTQHSLSCILTKMGYFFPDKKQGKIFLYNNGQLQEISSNGQRNFFRDFMRKTIIGNNPFIGNGYTSVYDEYYNRIIFTQNDIGASFTTSYDPIKEHWVSYHSYTPGYMWSVDNGKVFSFESASDKKIYEHNTGNFGQYYTAPVEPVIIEAVGNQAPAESKVLTSLEWINEAEDASNIFLLDETFDYATIKNNIQCSGRIDLEKSVNLNTFYNARQEQRTWTFNNFRNVAITYDFEQGFENDYALNTAALGTLDWFNQSRFVNKYFIVRLEYLNTNSNLLNLLELDFNYRQSYR